MSTCQQHALQTIFTFQIRNRDGYSCIKITTSRWCKHPRSKHHTTVDMHVHISPWTDGYYSKFHQLNILGHYVSTKPQRLKIFLFKSRLQAHLTKTVQQMNDKQLHLQFSSQHSQSPFLLVAYRTAHTCQHALHDQCDLNGVYTSQHPSSRK